MPGTNMTDARRLEIICDDVRKELTQTVRSWKLHEWARRFAAGLVARGVNPPQPTQTSRQSHEEDRSSPDYRVPSGNGTPRGGIRRELP